MIVFSWSLCVALITIKSYLLPYMKEPVLLETRMIITIVSKWLPRLDAVDYLLIVTTSLLSGAILLDLDKILYGWIAMTFLSFLMPVIFSAFFIWFALGAGEIFSSALGWELAVEQVSTFAFIIIFKMMFPIVPIFSLPAALVGALFRGLIQPSAEA